MSKYRLAIVDMDFTIIGSGRRYVLEEYDKFAGTDLSKKGNEIFKNLENKKITREDAVEELEKIINQIPLLIRASNEFYSELPIKAGFQEFVYHLKENKIKPVVLTIGDPLVADYIAKNYGIERKIFKTDAEKMKSYIGICNEYGVCPEQTICIGDGPQDMFSDRALKIKMLREDKKEDFPADAECRDFYEALDIVMLNHTLKLKIT